ncbi:molybdate ABC transporter permease subunit [Bacillaceae bacterium S4-13-58]
MDMTPFFLSIRIALLSTIIVFIIGTILARFISRRNFNGKTFLESLFMLPMVLPPTVIGFGLLYLFGKNGPLGIMLETVFDWRIVFTWHAAVLAATVVSFPLMYQSAAAAFLKYDRNIENAAYTLGASRWKVFWTISFPMAWPGLLAGVVLAFARGLGEFGATLMVAGYIPGKTDTLPMAIYFATEAGNTAQAGIWVLIIVFIGLTTIYWLNKWNQSPTVRFISKKKRGF